MGWIEVFQRKPYRFVASVCVAMQARERAALAADDANPPDGIFPASNTFSSSTALAVLVWLRTVALECVN